MIPLATYHKYMVAPWRIDIPIAGVEAGLSIKKAINEVSATYELDSFKERRAALKRIDFQFSCAIETIYDKVTSDNDTMHSAAERSCGGDKELMTDLTHTYCERADLIEHTRRDTIVTYRKQRAKVIKDARRHKVKTIFGFFFQNN